MYHDVSVMKSIHDTVQNTTFSILQTSFLNSQYFLTQILEGRPHQGTRMELRLATRYCQLRLCNEHNGLGHRRPEQRMLGGFIYK